MTVAMDGSNPPAFNDVAVDKVTVDYGAVRALDEVSFRLTSGVTGLLGPNGAGKSTLLRVIATAQSASSGTVTFNGVDGSSSRDRHAYRRSLGYLPQSPGVYPHFRVQEFARHVALLKQIGPRAAREDEVKRVLDLVGLHDRRRVKVRSLSGGMRQRLALACAVLGEPPLVVLDEPTVGLDPEQRIRFRELIANLGVGRTILLSTHQTDDVTELCRDVIVIVGGRVRFSGRIDDLTDLARGRVWRSTSRAPEALAGWLTADGSWRNIGTPPADAELIEPTTEDGYLVLASDGRTAR